VIESDEEDLTRIYDKETNITFDQIKEYICNDAINGLFTSSPYQERQNKRNKQVNQMNFKMECDVFEYVNITRDNLKVHLHFDETKPFKNEFNYSYYKDDFDISKMIINRTDAN